MLDLFRMETESHASALSEGLVVAERDSSDADLLRSLMRSAHSIKGAARIVRIEPAVELAHAMEDCFSAALESGLKLTGEICDLLLRGVDCLNQIAASADSIETWLQNHDAELQRLVENIRSASSGSPIDARPRTETNSPAEIKKEQGTALVAAPDESEPEERKAAGRFVRVSEEHLARLMSVAGETLVETRWLRPFSKSLLSLRKRNARIEEAMGRLNQLLHSAGLEETAEPEAAEIRKQIDLLHRGTIELYNDFEMHARRSARLANQLYRGVIESKMRPFADGVRAFPRMMRDLARSLGKKARFKISGHDTQVDRDILERIEAPLNHLLRNAIDHGIESPETRLAAGKKEEGLIRLEARHRSGVLSVTVEDDGRGVDYEKIREKVLIKKLAPPGVAERLTEAELIEFLFLPGFTTSGAVTELSGRGFGLDVVHNVAREIGGMTRAFSRPGSGLTIEMQLPITLSIMRALAVEIAGEPYAIPLARIERLLKLSPAEVSLMEDREYFTHGGRHIGLISARQALELSGPDRSETERPVVVISDRIHVYGLVVDRFIGERRLVVRPLDPRLGKVKNLSAVSLFDDGSPVLILDVDDLLRTFEKMLGEDALEKTAMNGVQMRAAVRKRVLVVDDSLTVREVERQLLVNHGYEVQTAVDGADGWNALRSSHFDLVVTDIDMPRMDGIELVRTIKADPNLRDTPVMIVSYKDREEDRRAGLDAGANYYLTKSSFHDESLLGAVIDLIGDSLE
ncbi:MAG: response regulator [bacterium]|nr:response regulator [bacterium]